MIDFINIFNTFEEPENSKEENDVSLLVDFSEHPLYWIGGFIKIINHHVFFTQYFIKHFKNLPPDLKLNELEQLGENLMYNRAWDYIKNININNPFHIECIKIKSSPQLMDSLIISIKHFESIEEYEKCALLKDIENKVKYFLI